MFHLLLYFLLTLILEIPIILWLFRPNYRSAFVVALLLNAFTWPLLNYLFLYEGVNIYLLELSAATIESLGFKYLLNNRWGISFIAGFIANAFSFGCGLLINGMP